MVRRRKAGPKYGKIGSPHSAKRKAWMRHIAGMRRNPRRRKTARRRR